MFELLASFVINYYLWIKALHIIGVITWMAGLFYLPRLFVYHTEHPECGHVFVKMEVRLYRYIIVPSMHFTVLMGSLLLFLPNISTSHSMHLKMSCVLCLAVFQFRLNCWQKELAAGKCSHSSRFFRIINEVPTVLLIIIVICVILKPF